MTPAELLLDKCMELERRARRLVSNGKVLVQVGRGEDTRRRLLLNLREAVETVDRALELCTRLQLAAPVNTMPLNPRLLRIQSSAADVTENLWALRAEATTLLSRLER